MSPTKEFLEAKKKESKIYRTEIAGQEFFFRAIRRDEHLAIQKEAFPEGVPLDAEKVSPEANQKLEDLIVRKCVVWPESVEPSKEGAGVCPMLVAMVMKYSGFGMAAEPEEV